MNSNLRNILIAIGLVTLLLIGLYVVPRGLSLFYQIRGGQHIEYVLRHEEGIEEMVCESLPSSDKDARQEIQDAIDDLNLAMRFNKNNSQAYYYLGKAHCLFGDPEGAKEYFQQHTELRPDNPLGYIGLGFAYEAVEDIPSAVTSWYESGLVIHDFIDAGQQENESKQYDNALKWYQRAERFDPKNGLPWFYIGSVLEELGDVDSARSAYEEAVRLSPDHVNSYYALGDIALNSDEDYESAIHYYREASEIDSIPIRAYLGIGESTEKIGDKEQALEAYTRANLLSNQVNISGYDDWWLHIWPTYTLGDFYLRNGEIDLAISTFAEGVDRDINEYFSAWFLWGLGRASVQNGDNEGAKEYLSQALNNKTNFYLSSQINLALGQAFIGQGDFDQGLEYIIIAHEKHQSNKGLHLYLADMLSSAGRLEEAIAEYQRYLEKWPSDLKALSALDALLED